MHQRGGYASLYIASWTFQQPIKVSRAEAIRISTLLKKNRSVDSGVMEARLLLLAAAVLTACCSSALEFKFPQSTNDDDSPVPSADTAMNYGTETLKLLSKSTDRIFTAGIANLTRFFAPHTAQCSSCSSIGCCPTIVTHSSVIQPVTGYRGNVAIIVDWGPRYDWGRACTTSDHGFM